MNYSVLKVSLAKLKFSNPKEDRKIEMNFREKVILITGGGSGIGGAAARHLAKLGARVAITDLNENGLKSVAADIKSDESPEPLIIVADVTRDFVRIIDETIKKFKQLNILVNCAGILITSPIGSIDIDVYDKIQSVNVRSVLILSQLAIPHLEKTKGNIINVSSVAALQPKIGSAAYCVSKAGLNMLTQCLALELGPKGIRVNAINPGSIKTPLFTAIGLDDAQTAEYLAKNVLKYPIGRVGETADTSSAIAFLASDEATFVTGVCLRVDGGRILNGV